MGQKDNSTANNTAPINRTRRWVLGTAAGLIAATTGVGAIVRGRDDPNQDSDGDGIPDSLEQSPRFHRHLRRVFNGEVTPLDPFRKDLLVDVRYIDGISISSEAKEYLQALFWENGISLQWLDYPGEYDLQLVRDRYGTDIESLLVAPDGFYWTEIDPLLQDTAFQLLVVPGRKDNPDGEKLYSRFYQDHVNGMNFGNRAAVANRDELNDEAELVLHEIAHLVLCHDDDPNNPGVMGRETEIDLMDREWELFRNGLDNIHDSTGVDLLSRRCLLEDYLDDTRVGKEE